MPPNAARRAIRASSAKRISRGSSDPPTARDNGLAAHVVRARDAGQLRVCNLPVTLSLYPPMRDSQRPSMTNSILRPAQAQYPADQRGFAPDPVDGFLESVGVDDESRS